MRQLDSREVVHHPEHRRLEQRRTEIFATTAPLATVQRRQDAYDPEGCRADVDNRRGRAHWSARQTSHIRQSSLHLRQLIQVRPRRRRTVEKALDRAINDAWIHTRAPGVADAKSLERTRA